MYIIVIGGGKVGYYLTKTLVHEGYEVLLIEKDRRKVETYAERFGSVVMQGDGCEARTMEEAGTGRADLVIAVTGDDEDNLVICQMAKHHFNVPKTISRVNNPKNETIFKKLGIDVTVSSTNVILSLIEEAIPSRQGRPSGRPFACRCGGYKSARDDARDIEWECGLFVAWRVD